MTRRCEPPAEETGEAVEETGEAAGGHFEPLLFWMRCVWNQLQNIRCDMQGMRADTLKYMGFHLSLMLR